MCIVLLLGGENTYVRAYIDLNDGLNDGSNNDINDSLKSRVSIYFFSRRWIGIEVTYLAMDMEIEMMMLLYADNSKGRKVES